MPFPTFGKRLGALIKKRLKSQKRGASGAAAGEPQSEATAQVALIPTPAIDLSDPRFSVDPFLTVVRDEAEKRAIYEEAMRLYLRRKDTLETFMRNHPRALENDSRVASQAKHYLEMQKVLEQAQQDIYKFEMAIMEQSVGIRREGDPSMDEQLAAAEAGWRVVQENFTELDNRVLPTRVLDENGNSYLFHGGPEMVEEEFLATYGSIDCHKALSAVVGVSCAFANMYCAGWEWLCAIFQRVILWHRVQVHDMALTFCEFGPR